MVWGRDNIGWCGVEVTLDGVRCRGNIGWSGVEITLDGVG